jgi:aminopeptidase N
MKTDTTPKTIKLEDYKAPHFKIESIYLTVDLHDTETQIHSKMRVVPNGSHSEKLILSGEELVLKSVAINGQILKANEFEVSGDVVVISKIPTESFDLEIQNTMNPLENKTLDGLYKSGNIYCTQCEPEGFRRITYYVDRPDNMAKFTTKVIGDKKTYPVLLSNGNPIERGELPNGKHFVVWEDPFKKPSYLFALVAGDLGVIKDTFKTKSNRIVQLEIYCDKGNEDKCHYAMESLKNSMKWDEDRFGLEYDLDIYMIVAVDAFNMGAMENKGLNVFNSAYVLAKPETATDENFYGIESVIGHEYFHNWTGNRVTCRDWFQLTLKEGLTVFRDQEFSADLNSRDVERITSVVRLRNAQFPEDQGPTSHPIKPDTYIEINNFYTATVYEKGAEVIRMLQTLLGVDGFRKGMDKYFELFDGQAVRTEDFLYAMSEANNKYDLTQFKNWYSQNGTPHVFAKTQYDQSSKKFTVSLKQVLPTNTIKEAKPFHMPIIIGLVDSHGNDLAEKICELKTFEQDFVFENITGKPVASINRKFSAPIKLQSDLSFEDQIFLMAHDQDSFNRYEASQVVATKIINQLIEDHKNNNPLVVNPKYIEAFGKILTDEKIDEAFKALTMTLPEENIIHQEQDPILYKETHFVREFVKRTLAHAHEETLFKMYNDLNLNKEYKLDNKSAGKRDLKSKCRKMLMYVGNNKYESYVYNLYLEANNMTDEIGDLRDLVHAKSTHMNEALDKFYKKWKHETLVMQKWLTVQAQAPYNDAYEFVLKLENDPVYDKTVPNLVRSLLLQFATNKLQFNHESGRGYKLVSDRIIELDKLNPQVASRLASQFKDFKRLPENLKNLMKPELERIVKTPGLSKNVFEIVSKILGI